MSVKASEAVALVRERLDELDQAEYRRFLLAVYKHPVIKEVDEQLTAMGFATPESKLKALDPLFKKFY